MTLCFNEEGDASQIYMPVRVLSLEIREGHYAAERGRSSLPRGMAVSALSTNQMLGVSGLWLWLWASEHAKCECDGK